VPGSAELEVDICTNNREIFEKIDAEIMEICEVVARRRDIEISVQPLSSEPPVLLPKDLSCVVAEVCRSYQIS
jgi:acetylornithine deacetylase/succinyl-diaminopimelate desuccinylase-like protein